MIEGVEDADKEEEEGAKPTGAQEGLGLEEAVVMKGRGQRRRSEGRRS